MLRETDPQATREQDGDEPQDERNDKYAEGEGFKAQHGLRRLYIHLRNPCLAVGMLGCNVGFGFERFDTSCKIRHKIAVIFFP